MDIVHPRVAGIDVHKKVIWGAVRLPGAVRRAQGDRQELQDVLAVAAEDGGVAGGARRHRCRDGPIAITSGSLSTASRLP